MKSEENTVRCDNCGFKFDGREMRVLNIIGKNENLCPKCYAITLKHICS